MSEPEANLILIAVAWVLVFIAFTKLLEEMMNKERELLRRISSHNGSVIPSHLIDKIQELLAQPELSTDSLQLGEYDAGLLSDFGGDTVQWQNYMRTELERAHDYYQSQVNQVIAQNETNQEIKIGIYDDIFSDYEYLVTAFKNGANADDYSRDISRAFSDIRKARNWICPLPKHVMDELTLKSFEEVE